MAFEDFKYLADSGRERYEDALDLIEEYYPDRLDEFPRFETSSRQSLPS